MEIYESTKIFRGEDEILLESISNSKNKDKLSEDEDNLKLCEIILKDSKYYFKPNLKEQLNISNNDKSENSSINENDNLSWLVYKGQKIPFNKNKYIIKEGDIIKLGREWLLIKDIHISNNTRKKLFLNLKTCLEKEEDKENKKKELVKKVVEIEETIYNKYKGESAYTNRVLEILHNLKTNEEFKEKIVSGKITPGDLANMDVIDMVDKNKRKEIDKAIENKVNSVRSDWEQKHAKVSSGVYKCRKCGCDKTRQYEMQTRSADEPMTLFITCVECGNSWKN